MPRLRVEVPPHCASVRYASGDLPPFRKRPRYPSMAQVRNLQSATQAAGAIMTNVTHQSRWTACHSHNRITCPMSRAAPKVAAERVTRAICIWTIDDNDGPARTAAQPLPSIAISASSQGAKGGRGGHTAGGCCEIFSPRRVASETVEEDGDERAPVSHLEVPQGREGANGGAPCWRGRGER